MAKTIMRACVRAAAMSIDVVSYTVVVEMVEDDWGIPDTIRSADTV
jgi:hypothetical protein